MVPGVRDVDRVVRRHRDVVHGVEGRLGGRAAVPPIALAAVARDGLESSGSVEAVRPAALQLDDEQIAVGVEVDTERRLERAGLPVALATLGLMGLAWFGWRKKR